MHINTFLNFTNWFSILSFAVLLGCTEQILEKPNIILIMSDDQAWGDTEIAGNIIIDTPNLNKIAKQGVQFDRFFVSPMCAPTRASLLTGRYNLRTGTTWVGRRTEALALDEITLAEILKANGYATGCFGKWHLGPYPPYYPTERGFDEFTGFLFGDTENYFHSHLEHNGRKFTSDEYITDLLTDSALHFIESKKDQPFFCYIPYNVPHHPFQVPERYFTKYKELGVENNRTAAVYGMVDNMDENIGRILSRIEELDISENTIVIFLSDNGPQFARYNDGMAGLKAEVSEGSIRVPFYIKWKNHFPEGKHVADISAHIDVLPTILDAANIPVPEEINLDGISLLPLINGEQSTDNGRMIFTHQSVFGVNHITPGSVRTQQYRLVNWKNGYELFDMQSDPSQKRDISAEETETTRELINAYENWYRELSLDGLNPPPVPIGYHTNDTVNLHVPDALLKGSLRYNGKGWSSDYLVDWKDVNDSVILPLYVYSSGTYEFSLQYACNVEEVGTRFQLSYKEQKITNQITIPNDAPFLEMPNVASLGRSQIKEWAELTLGTMELEKGEQKMVLQALKIPGNSVGEIKSIDIIKQR